MGVKKYFSREFQLSMFGLEEESATEFYVSCFQKNRSAVPLMLIRLIVLIGCIGIFLTSLIMTVGNHRAMAFGLWFIFLTHWGLIFIMATACFGFAISVIAYLQGSIDTTFGLPWYVKAYWVTYNLTLPIAFFITLFYWVFLTGLDEDFAINKTLDIFIHGINSVLMLILLFASSHSSRILHFHHSILTGIVYLIFSVIFHYAGGRGPTGASYIYPMLDWSKPDVAAITSVGSAVMIFIMHLVVVGLTATRNAFTRNNSSSLPISNDRFN